MIPCVEFASIGFFSQLRRNVELALLYLSIRTIYIIVYVHTYAVLQSMDFSLSDTVHTYAVHTYAVLQSLAYILATIIYIM
jgi:uncharacterized MAPEG superfamily protein